MFFVYALRSVRRNYIYVGLTEDINRRFKQHNTGLNHTTRPYLPFQIILTEHYPSRRQARLREKYLKSGCGKEFLKTLIS